MVACDGTLVASADTLTQLVDVHSLGIGVSPGDPAPITCGMVSAPPSDTKGRCNCKGLGSTSRLPPFLD